MTRIDIESERLIEFRKVPAELEPKLGKRLNLATLYRWKQRGIAGVRLQTIRIGGGSYTSWEALNRFFHESSEARTEVQSASTKQGMRRAKAKQQEAEELGI